MTDHIVDQRVEANNGAALHDPCFGFSIGDTHDHAHVRFISVANGAEKWRGSAFAAALRAHSVPTSDSYVCHKMAKDYRNGENWESASYLPHDLDCHNRRGEKDRIPDDIRKKIAELIAQGKLPGNAHHDTPNGMRIFTLVSRLITDVLEYKKVWEAGARQLSDALSAAGIPVSRKQKAVAALVVDAHASGIVQPMRTPLCTVQTELEARNAEIHILREAPYSVDELLVAAGMDADEDVSVGDDGEKDCFRFELDDGKYFVELERVSRNRCRATFITKDEDSETTVCRDVFNIDSKAARTRFVGQVCRKIEGINTQELEDALVEIASEYGKHNDTQSHGNRLDFFAANHGMGVVKATPHGHVKEKLSNFWASVIKDAEVNDGVEVHRIFTIQTQLEGAVRTFDVPANRFASLEWVPEHVGATAMIAPVPGAKDLLRAAIQETSTAVERTTIYSHLGWIKQDGQNVYLHGGGAIGQNGAVGGVEVCLPGQLQNFNLPNPPTREELQKNIKAIATFLKVAPKSIMFPLLGGVFRAALGPCDVSIHLHGQTGSCKSELAALAQRFYGKDMDRENLPQNWTSTDNSIEGTCFHAKDAFTVIDDFTTGENVLDAQRQNRKADRVFRGQGNGQGRNRMAPDGSLRPIKPSRTFILSTGEEIPTGGSCRARIVLTEVKPGDVSLQALTKAQVHAASGAYATVMAGFLQWLAPRLGVERERLKNIIGDWRTMEGMPHGRTAGNLAQLFFGIDLFLSFAVEVAAITEPKAAAIKENAKLALIALAGRQSEHLRDTCPAQRFVELVASVLTNGNAHLSNLDGSLPEHAEALGWHSGTLTRCIGWTNGEYVYLHPAESFAAVQEVARRMGESMGIQRSTLWARLRDKGLLVETAENRGRLTVRKVIPCRRQRIEVLVLKLRDIISVEPVEQQQKSQPQYEAPDINSDDILDFTVIGNDATVEKESTL